MLVAVVLFLEAVVLLLVAVVLLLEALVAALPHLEQWRQPRCPSKTNPKRKRKKRIFPTKVSLLGFMGLFTHFNIFY